jgi:hypothetical protein
MLRQCPFLIRAVSASAKGRHGGLPSKVLYLPRAYWRIGLPRVAAVSWLQVLKPPRALGFRLRTILRAVRLQQGLTPQAMWRNFRGDYAAFLSVFS